MKRNSYSTLVFAAVMALGLLATGMAMAVPADPLVCPGYTPAPNSAVIATRIWNDCPGSDLSTLNNYPAVVVIRDADDGCTGTNFHNWSFSEDGITKAAFENCSHFKFGTVVTLASPYGEAGLRLSPWWGPETDGKFMINAGGEIACFGGRLPFYTFTGAYGLHYVPGTQIWMQITYDPNSLTAADPATIEYQVFYNGVGYSSGPLKYDEGNGAEGHGTWGNLYPSYAGGYVQAPNWNGGAAYNMVCSWENILFEGPSATPAATSTWGQLKSLYR